MAKGAYYYSVGGVKHFGNDLRALALKAQKDADRLGRAIMMYATETAAPTKKVYKSNPARKKAVAAKRPVKGKIPPGLAAYNAGKKAGMNGKPKSAAPVRNRDSWLKGHLKGVTSR